VLQLLFIGTVLTYYTQCLVFISCSLYKCTTMLLICADTYACWHVWWIYQGICLYTLLIWELLELVRSLETCQAELCTSQWLCITDRYFFSVISKWTADFQDWFASCFLQLLCKLQYDLYSFFWPPCVMGQAIIFVPCVSIFPSFFSSPNLSGWRLDVYHTSTHSVALVRI